jgi:ribosomal-protein-alanine N-acetyltransferase
MINIDEIEISKMSLQDYAEIRHTLTTDYDDFWNAETLENELKSENSYYFVAKLNNTIVGFAGIKTILDEADIMNIVIKKDSRNLGIGSALFNYILNFSKSNNIKKITLEVNEKNVYAIMLYKKFGFNIIAKRPKYYNGTNTALIMQISFD